MARLEKEIDRLQMEINVIDVDIDKTKAGLTQLPSELLDLRQELKLTFDLDSIGDTK